MKRILVIEDDPAIQMGLVASLEEWSYAALTASDGGEGYRLAKQEGIDLIILDLMLPTKNGQEICRDLRADGVRTPILMLTSKKQELDVVQGFEVGAGDYMTKPFSIRELRARVDVLLKRSQEYRSALNRVNELSHELENARRVQQNLFPKILPAFQGWEFAGFCRPALIVGGDYYDIFECSPGKVIATLGDVSGKGLGPSLHMASVHSAIRSRAGLFLQEPAAFVEELNRYLVLTTSPETFITLFLGVLDIATGSFEYVNCGHPHPIVVRHKAGAYERLGGGGSMLGMFGNAVFSKARCTLEPGETLMLFSDGVTEAMNRKKESYEEQRLLKALSAVAREPAETILGQVIHSVDDFVKTRPQSDDISMVVIRRKDVK